MLSMMQPRRVVIDITKRTRDYIDPNLPPNIDDHGKPTNKTDGLQVPSKSDMETAGSEDGDTATN
jgi:hypothetical protein